MERDQKRDGNIPLQHKQFARLQRQVRAAQRKGITPSEEQVSRLRELDSWLTENTDYWNRRDDNQK